jgi:quinoprotein glucose dehydrogenase
VAADFAVTLGPALQSAALGQASRRRYAERQNSLVGAAGHHRRPGPFSQYILGKSGTPNLGGPISTAGGLVFIGAAMDNYLRAFDAKSGMELWKGRLPAGGQATPMTYMWKGKQYVVIAAGGQDDLGTKPGDELIAFALPD